MRNISMLLRAISLTVVVLFSSCQKMAIEEIELYGDNILSLNCPVKSVHGSEKRIVGKWKLVKERGGLRPEGSMDEDYSCNNVIFNFLPNGKLEITSDNNYYRTGQTTYEYIRSPYTNFKAYERFTLKTGKNSGEPLDFKENGRIMVLNSSYMDGTTKYLVRIQ